MRGKHYFLILLFILMSSIMFGVTIDGSNDFSSNEKYQAGEGKFIYISTDNDNLYLGFENENMAMQNKAFYIAVDSTPDNSSDGTTDLFYSNYLKGSRVNTTFKATHFFIIKKGSSVENYKEVYQGSWQDELVTNSNVMDSHMGTSYSEFKISLNSLGNPSKIRLTAYAKDLNSNNGWGWLFGSLESGAPQGKNDKTITSYKDFTLSSIPTTPELSSSNPTNGTTNVGRNSNVSITFTESMNTSTVNAGVALKDSSNNSISVNVSTNDNVTYLINPNSTLDYNEVYSLSISDSIESSEGVDLLTSYNISFTTEEEVIIVPSVSNNSPADGATNISENTTITVSFSEVMNFTTVENGFAIKDTNNNFVNGSLTSNDNINFVFTPNSSLEYLEYYTYELNNSIKSNAGVNLDKNYLTTFRIKQESQSNRNVEEAQYKTSWGTFELTSMEYTTGDFQSNKLQTTVGGHDGYQVAKEEGAIIKSDGTRFVLWSSKATRVELNLFNSGDDEDPYKIINMKNMGNSYWLADVGGAYEGTLYGYRAWGSNFTYDENWAPGGANASLGFKADVDGAGNRFNPNKLLVDPYAKAMTHDTKWIDGKSFASGELEGTEFRFDNSAEGVGKSIVVDDSFNWTANKPAYSQKDRTIYEVHLRGLTKDLSFKKVLNKYYPSMSQSEKDNIYNNYAGTYKAVEYMIPYFKELGITTLEFLPVQETDNDGNTIEKGNFWGYMTMNYFSPDRRYSTNSSADAPVKEWKEMVNKLHAAGLEVFLDVVYNHTGEGGIWRVDGAEDVNLANVTSFRGIDNEAYYELTSDNLYNWDNTGCGGNVNVAHPKINSFVRDSLSYWKNEMQVDGFRFDLASVLGNTKAKHGFEYGRTNSLLEDIAKDPKLSGAEFVAEPWALGGGTYRVGEFPNGWSEWNGKYRDTIRGFIRGDEGIENEVMTRVAGSNDLYGNWWGDHRQPYNGINKLTAHDGLSLNDVVTYNSNGNEQKDALNAQPAPFGPSDGGHDNNVSWDSMSNEDLRRQQIRNFAVLQFMSAGTPMIFGGDEFRRTKAGNNNTYNIDNETNWFDWDWLDGQYVDNDPIWGDKVFGKRFWITGRDKIFEFYKGMIKLRNEHPALRRAKFFNGGDNNGDGINDISWYSDDSSRTIGWRIDGSAHETGAEANDNDFFVFINTTDYSRSVYLPGNRPGKKWYRIADTNVWAENAGSINNCIDVEDPDMITDSSYLLSGRSALVLIEK